VQPSDGTKQASAASIKSTKILSMFWGDDQDTDRDPETDNESHNWADATKFLVTTPDPGKKGKRGRPKKQQSPNNTEGTSVKTKSASQDFPVDVVNTRSKAGRHLATYNSSHQ